MNTTSRTMEAVTARLKTGTAILAAAEVVDTTRVATRLAAFAEAHRNLAEAERKVDEAEARLEAERLKLAQRGADHDDAVELLACRLVNDGQPRRGNPFGAFGAATPSGIKHLPPAEAAQAVRALIAAIRRVNHLSPPTLEAVQQLEEATRQVEAAVVPVEQLSAELRTARHGCEVIGRAWLKARGVLRRGAQAASDEGASDLYDALFKTGVLARRTKSRPVAAQATSETPASAPAAA